MLEWLSAPPALGGTQNANALTGSKPSVFFLSGLAVWLLLGGFFQRIYYMPPAKLWVFDFIPWVLDVLDRFARSELGSTRLSPYLMGPLAHTGSAFIAAVLLYLPMKFLHARATFRATIAAMCYVYAGPVLAFSCLAWASCAVLFKDRELCQPVPLSYSSPELKNAIQAIWGHADAPPPLTEVVPKVVLIFYSARALSAMEPVRWWRPLVVAIAMGWFVVPEVLALLNALTISAALPFLWNK